MIGAIRERVRKPWAIVPPKGVCLARSTSTWMNWWSSAASANWLTRSWVISRHSLKPRCRPTQLGRSDSSMVSFVVVIRRLQASFAGTTYRTPLAATFARATLDHARRPAAEATSGPGHGRAAQLQVDRSLQHDDRDAAGHDQL